MPNASAAELLKEKLVKPGGRLEPETQPFEVARIYPPFDEEKGPNSQQDCEGGRGEDGEERRYLFPKPLCLRKWHQEHTSN